MLDLSQSGVSYLLLHLQLTTFITLSVLFLRKILRVKIAFTSVLVTVCQHLFVLVTILISLFFANVPVFYFGRDFVIFEPSDLKLSSLLITSEVSDVFEVQKVRDCFRVSFSFHFFPFFLGLNLNLCYLFFAHSKITNQLLFA